MGRFRTLLAQLAFAGNLVLAACSPHENAVGRAANGPLVHVIEVETQLTPATVRASGLIGYKRESGVRICRAGCRG